MDIIRTLHLCHRFVTKDGDGKVISSKDALDDVNLSIEEGSFTAIIGRNGSGKSTMARHLNALLRPTSGTVLVDGMDTADESRPLAIREKAGMVFQNPDNQIIASVVEEDVAFGPENIGLPPEEIWERVAQSLESVGLSSCRYMSPERLSGGQKQRVAIAGIMAMRPSCMILDEPTAMLDPAGRQSVMDAVKKLNAQEKVTIILITHYMEEAAMADRIIVMDQGRPAADGSPGEIFSDEEKLDRLHLSLPPAVRLAHELQRRGIGLPDGIIDADSLVQALTGVLCRK